MADVAWGIVMATGKDERLSNGTDSALLSLGGAPMIAYSLRAFERAPGIEGVLVAAPPDRMQELARLARLYNFTKLRHIFCGAVDTLRTLRSALEVLDEQAEYVVLQSAARPCVDAALVGDLLSAARRHGCAAAAGRIDDPLYTAGSGRSMGDTFKARTLWRLQDPLALRRPLLERALATKARAGGTTSSLPERLRAARIKVHFVAAPYPNLRIAAPEDLAMAEGLLRW